MLLKSAFVLTVLASVALAQVPPHHKINGFVPPKLYGKQQLRNAQRFRAQVETGCHFVFKNIFKYNGSHLI
jgi:hypothetical protein